MYVLLCLFSSMPPTMCAPVPPACVAPCQCQNRMRNETNGRTWRPLMFDQGRTPPPPHGPPHAHVGSLCRPCMREPPRSFVTQIILLRRPSVCQPIKVGPHHSSEESGIDMIHDIRTFFVCRGQGFVFKHGRQLFGGGAGKPRGDSSHAYFTVLGPSTAVIVLLLPPVSCNDPCALTARCIFARISGATQ